MHGFNMATLFAVLSLIGVEFSVYAFINPAARRLDPEPQLKLLSRLASVFGRVMTVWYPVCALLLVVETWLYLRSVDRNVLLAVVAIWLLASVASIVFLVPMNTPIAERAADWERTHRIGQQTSCADCRSRHRSRPAHLRPRALSGLRF